MIQLIIANGLQILGGVGFGMGCHLFATYLMTGSCLYSFGRIGYMVIGLAVFCAFMIGSWPLCQVLAYLPLMGALLITFSTDIRFFLISRFVTLFLIPVPVLLRFYGVLPGGLLDGLWGALACGGFLWSVRRLFQYRTGVDGLGIGDIDCALLLGAYLGLYAGWVALTIASVGGAIISVIVRVLGFVPWDASIPFGAYLALGGLLALLFLC